MNAETDEQRVMRKFVEKLEAFRLACKQVELGAEELEKYFRDRMTVKNEN